MTGFTTYTIGESFVFKDELYVSEYFDLDQIFNCHFVKGTHPDNSTQQNVDDAKKNSLYLPYYTDGFDVQMIKPLVIVVNENGDYEGDPVKQSLLTNVDTKLKYNYKEPITHNYEHKSENRRMKKLSHTLYICDLVEDAEEYAEGIGFTNGQLPCFQCQLAEHHWINANCEYFSDAKEDKIIKTTKMKRILPDSIMYPNTNYINSIEGMHYGSNIMGIYKLIDIVEREFLTMGRQGPSQTWLKSCIDNLIDSGISVNHETNSLFGIFEHTVSGKLQIFNLLWMVHV